MAIPVRNVEHINMRLQGIVDEPGGPPVDAGPPLRGSRHMIGSRGVRPGKRGGEVALFDAVEGVEC